MESCRVQPGFTLTEEKIKTYSALLSDIQDLAGLEAAFRKAAQECQWFPSVADIRERLSFQARHSTPEWREFYAKREERAK